MKYLLSYETVINLRFTEAEFNLLNESLTDSEYHSETLIGGWWYGYKNTWLFSTEDVAILSTSFRNVDKVIKSLEKYYWLYSDDNKKNFAATLRNKLVAILSAANDQSQHVYAAYNQNFLEL